jgi:hypothetical protein
MIILIKLIPNNPNQRQLIYANNQNITLNLYLRGYITDPNPYSPPSFFADIYLGNTQICGGLPVIDRQVINQYPSIMNGYLVMINSINNDNPNLINLGITSNLYYVSTIAEIQDVRF